MPQIDPTARRSWRFRAVVGALTLAMFLSLGWAMLGLDVEGNGLTTQAQAQLDASGVGHPVTAVLLNFRAYDTWLEVVVLFLAAAGTLVLRQSAGAAERPAGGVDEPVLVWLARILVPLAVVAGVYLLWLGTAAPGGAFQAGAVLGAAGVLLRLSGHRSAGLLPAWLLRSSLLAGGVVFLVAGVATLLLGNGFLTYPPRSAGLLIIAVELLVTWTVAVTFVVLFIAARPAVSEPAS